MSEPMSAERLSRIKERAVRAACGKHKDDGWLFCRIDAPELIAEVERLTSENARLRGELEAITKQINSVRTCKMCVHHKSDVFENPCAVCNMIVKQNFKWACPCLANTPAQGATDETRGGTE